MDKFLQVLFNWDAGDDIKEAHKLFAPACPLVTGEALPPLPQVQPIRNRMF